MNKHLERTKVDMTTWNTYTLVVVRYSHFDYHFSSALCYMRCFDQDSTLGRYRLIFELIYFITELWPLIHIRISLVFILLLDIEMLTIVLNFNIHEDTCHTQPSSEHFSS